MTTRWGKAEDAKLATLFGAPRNGVDPKDLSVAAVKAVHKKYFPTFDYKNFAPLYRGKARNFNVGKSLEGHRARSRQAKAAAREESLEGAKGEDEDSEDDEDYEDDEEDDIDLDDFIEEDEQELAEEVEEMPTKRAPRKAAQKANEVIEDLSNDISTMSISSKVAPYRPWAMDFSFPFMIKKFLHDGRESCTVDILVPTIHEDRLHPRLINEGKVLAIGVAVPDFFPEEERLLVASGTHNINTSQAAAHSQVVQEIRDAFNDVNEIVGKPQLITLPFPCEEHIAHWEGQLFHGDADVSAALEEQQYHNVLQVSLFSKKRPTARRNRGVMRVVGSPVLSDHHQQQQQNQNASIGTMNLN